MKNSLRLLLLLLVAPLTWVQAEPLKVFILSGQSNMVGSGTEVPEEYRDKPLEGVTLFQVPKHGKPLKNPLIYRSRKEKAPGFGPELSFALEIQKALGEDIGILKYAIGCRSLGTHFVPSVDEAPEGSKRNEHMWAELRRQILAVKAMGNVEFAGMLWLQGERDIKEEAPDTAKNYAANLKLLIDKARATTGVADLPFVAGRVNPPAPGERFDLVRGAIETGGGAEHNAWIGLDEITKSSDNLHYNSEGTLLIGKAFAARLLELMQE